MDKAEQKQFKEIVEGYFRARVTTQDEMILVVKQYIKIRKDEDVTINVLKKVRKGMSDGAVMTILWNELTLMGEAMDAAVVWLLNNRAEWTS